jgi:hypothetical protein
VGASIAGRGSAGTGDQVYISANTYYDGTTWRYIETNPASNYYQDNGEHVWRTAVNGSAGVPTTFSERMRIYNGGDISFRDTSSNNAFYWDASAARLGIGTPSPIDQLHIKSSTTDARMVLDGHTGFDAELKFFEAGTAKYTVGYDAATTNFVIGTVNVDTNQRLVIDSSGNVGIGTDSPSVSLDISDTDAIKIPAGTTAQRPTGANGMLRYNSDDAQFEGYADGAWGAIAGSGGGGGGSSTIYRETFSGDNSTTVFTLSNTIADEANTQVYIDGVYQSKLNYSTSGTSLTFTTAPPTGTNNIEVVHIAAAAVSSTSGLIQNSFTGNGSTVDFTLSITPTDENFTFVFIQGVYQDKSTYTVSGNTITFSTAPQNGYNIEVMSIGAVNLQQASYLEYDNFTGNGSTTNYTLLNGSPSDEKFTMVYIQGVYQEKSTYSLSAGDIIFSTAPQSGYTIEIISVNGGGIQAAQSYTLGSEIVTSVNGETGDVTVASTIGVNVISSDTTATANNLYVFTANLTLTLPASPSAGDSIKISNRSGTTTCVLGRNGNNIMGSASDLTLDTASASFELIYSGAAQGWVIIGQ